jgi:hypothetical protein
MEETEDGPEVGEAIRIGIDVVLTLLCIYVMWGYVKDRPEIVRGQERAAAWWHEATTRSKRMKKMENETVFEAIRVVDSAGD